MRRTKANLKGKSRHFSSPEEIQSQLAKLELKEGEGSSSEAEENSDSDESSSDEDRKPKGVSGLIEIENPNRVSKKPSAAAAATSAAAPATANGAPKVELSRREREEIEKQRAKERYDKLHAAGKTDQAKADLARLALIREKREQEAAKRREENRAREEESKKKMQSSGRKTDAGAGSSKK